MYSEKESVPIRNQCMCHNYTVSQKVVTVLFIVARSLTSPEVDRNDQPTVNNISAAESAANL